MNTSQTPLPDALPGNPAQPLQQGTAAHAADLRTRAHAVLKPGAPQSVASDAAQALRVLFDLASSTDTAADALALLHELQVHQVELDLQAQELRESRLDLETACAAHARLHDLAPTARAELDQKGCVRVFNATAALYLGTTGVLGLPFATCLSQASRPVFDQLCHTASAGGMAGSAVLSLQAPGQSPHQVVASVCVHPAGAGFLLDWLAMPTA